MAPLTWGVTVEEVSALAPHITIKADPAEPLSGDLTFGATVPRAVTVSQVERFIEDVAARVDMRLLRMALITDQAIKNRIEAGAHDLTVNGAGSYLVAAAFPAKAGLNDNSSLSAELWRRFTEGLEALATAVTEWTDPNSGLPGSTHQAGSIEGFFPATKFPDELPGGYPVECPPGAWMYPWR